MDLFISANGQRRPVGARPILIAITMFAALLWTSAFAQKNVAVLEIDRHADIQEEISRREAMEITNVIRGEAVKNLPRPQYSVMTSETVQAMGDVVLAECADQNCVISIGRTIDAEYIVRGTLSKFQTRFTLNIEMFETEFGNLIATAAPVRSESLNDLLDKTAEACAAMYRNFTETETAQTTLAPPPPVKAKPAARERTNTGRPYKLTLQISAGALAVGGLVGGLIVNGMVEDEFKKYEAADKGSPAERTAKKNTESNITTRNILYILGGIGAAGLTATFFF